MEKNSKNAIKIVIEHMEEEMFEWCVCGKNANSFWRRSFIFCISGFDSSFLLKSAKPSCFV